MLAAYSRRLTSLGLPSLCPAGNEGINNLCRSGSDSIFYQETHIWSIRAPLNKNLPYFL